MGPLTGSAHEISASPTEENRLLAVPAEDALPGKSDAGGKARSSMAGLSLCGRVRYLAGMLTVEPTLWLFCMSVTMGGVATQNLSLEKACRVNLALEQAVCDALSARSTANYTAQESQVQQLTARAYAWRSFVQAAVPALLILFVGSWSDRHGRRKPFIMLPIAGQALNAVGHLVCTFFFLELPIEADLFSEAVFPSITGGGFVFYMAIYTFIADITTVEERTFRIGLLHIVAFSSEPIGVSLSGILFELIGFYGVFSLSLAMYLGSLTLCYYLVQDKPKKWGGDGEKPSGVCGLVRDFFDVRLLKDTFDVAFRRGPERRLRVILLMFLVALQLGTYIGEETIMYLFVRLKFNWDGLMFSYFSGYVGAVHIIGMALSVGVFTSWLKLSDSVVGMVACASKFLGAALFCFTPTATTVLLAPAADFLKDSAFIALRSITSKVVSPEDLGKTNSLVGISEALSPIVCGTLYSMVYYTTLSVLPGAFFLVSCAISTCTCAIFGWFYYLAKRQDAADAEEAHETDDAEAKTPLNSTIVIENGAKLVVKIQTS